MIPYEQRPASEAVATSGHGRRSELDELLEQFLPDVAALVTDEPESWKAEQIRSLIYSIKSDLTPAES